MLSTLLSRSTTSLLPRVVRPLAFLSYTRLHQPQGLFACAALPRQQRPSRVSARRWSNMSDSEASDFRIDDSDSDGYVQPVKATKAAPKKAAATKAAKPAAKKAPAKKPLATKKNLPNDSISEDENMSLPSSPAKPKAAADETAVVAPKGPPKTASEMYQKLSQLEHVLKRPDTYIGSVEPITQDMWVVDPETKKVVYKSIKYVPGFFKIFDEILVNAADNKINDPTMDTIKVEIDREKNRISVMNTGKGIPVEIHSKEKIMIPELIFGNLLTSSNYDDDQKKLTGGRNGYGAKLANIYSTEFIVETADKVNGKKYKQVFSNNMSKKSTPKITANNKGEEWTKITFAPELARFHMEEIDDDTYSLLMKRVYDIAGTVKDVKVHFNGERLKIKGFKQYVEMYLQANQVVQMEELGLAAQPKPALVYESDGKRWEVAFALSEGESLKQVSFCNAIATIKGGTHVEMIANQIAKKLAAEMTKKNKKLTIKPGQIKNHMWIFVNALIENPAFDSQTKETLTLKSTAFGSKFELSDDFIKKVAKCGLVDNVLSYAQFKQDKALKKTDGSKRSRVGGITKLEDANWAGSSKGKYCTLILTEGDSAKALAVSGLGAIQGRDRFGVFPLRGKLLNVRDASHEQIMNNVEIQNIKKIMGLKHNFNYTSVDSLRYGSIMVMTDQDHDGSHIKGLIINFLDHFYPSLLKLPEFLVEFITPIVKVWKGKQERTFFTIPQYEEWKNATHDSHTWHYKYLKGLGSSGRQDAVKYFSDLETHRLNFEIMGPEDKALIDLAFNKKKADDRKEWLRQFKPGTYLDHDIKTIPIADFVNKELVLFSMADNIRSIPSVADGLKPGQRKVMYGCFSRKFDRGKEQKLSELGGFISGSTSYQHGEASLHSTMIGLAQNFVGSNNINLLEPKGQFGTRMQGGKDAASPRYIYTIPSPISRAIFHKEDDALLNNLFEDGKKIEPEYYLPTVPLVLINGADGIGTGWSTAIPNYNPMDVVDNLKRVMRGEDLVPMTPWFRGFKGTIERVGMDKFKVSGIAEKIDDTTIEITELPIRKWTQDFKEMIEKMTGDKAELPIKDYEEHHTDVTVHFKLKMKPSGMEAAEKEGFDNFFKLTTTTTTTNMVCFDLHGKIKKYSSPEQILQDFYPKRLEYYGLRKQYLADELNKQFEKLSNQARFVNMIIKKELVVSNKKKAVIVAELREHKFRAFPKNGPKAAEAGETEEALEDPEEPGSAGDFDYLLGMPIYSLTEEKVNKLLAERDEKEQELLVLLQLSPQDIWNTDLDKFVTEWERCLQEDADLAQQTKPKTHAQIKRKAKAIKRAKGEDDDDSEDDFKPVKKVAKPRAPAKPRQPKIDSVFASATTSVLPSANTSRATSPAKREINDLSEGSDVDVKPPVKRAARAKAKPITVDLDDSDDDMYTLPASVATSKPPSTVSTTKPSVSAQPTPAPDADSDDEILTKPKPKPAPRKVTAPKTKAVKAAPKAAAKPVAEDEASDDDIAMLSEPEAESTPKPAPKAKAAAKKAAPAKGKGKKADESDFEEDSEEFAPTAPRATTARAGRAAAKKKPTYVDLSDLDSD